MASQLVALCFDAHDPARLATFWAGVLGWQAARDDDTVLLPNDDTGFELRFCASEVPKSQANQMHFDLTSSSLANQQQTVERALSLGGRHLDIGQGADAEHVVLADPEGNEFCVIEPGNNFLAECGFVGALASDGTQEVGYFWCAALDWPLVWDQDQETAIRSPLGGPKITWGGPPVAAKVSRNRLHFHLAPAGGDDQQQEVARLVSLGATEVRPDATEDGRVKLLDPDGNEFCLLPAI